MHRGQSKAFTSHVQVRTPRTDDAARLVVMRRVKQDEHSSDYVYTVTAHRGLPPHPCECRRFCVCARQCACLGAHLLLLLQVHSQQKIDVERACTCTCRDNVRALTLPPTQANSHKRPLLSSFLT